MRHKTQTQPHNKTQPKASFTSVKGAIFIPKKIKRKSPWLDRNVRAKHFILRLWTFITQKIKKRKENKQMAVIIKLNGEYIGETTMSQSEISNAEKEGFTILRKGE